MFEDIKIFAADHRKGVEWNLPYIRLGNCQSDAANKITTVPVLRHKSLSEVAQAIDIKNRWKEFGMPSWLGLCHYRRFFTIAFKGQPLFDLTEDQFDPNMCCTPVQQLALAKHAGADIICFARVRSYKDEDIPKVKNLLDEIELHGKKVCLNMSRQQIETAFHVFHDCLPSELQQHFDDAMKKTTVHCCNLFTAKSELFCCWAQTLEDAYSVCAKKFDSCRSNFNKRWFGYLSERFTSIFLDCNEMSGKKKLYLPLLTINGKVHLEK